MDTFNWSKKLLGCTYRLSRFGEAIGELRSSNSRPSGRGTVGAHTLRFRAQGWLHPRTHLLDGESGEPIGQVTYSCWGTKAWIQLGTERYRWRFKSWLGNSWSVTDELGNEVGSFRGNAYKGEALLADQAPDALALASLLVANYYWNQASIAMACVFPTLLMGIM